MVHFVMDEPNDKEQLAPGFDSVSAVVGRVSHTLVDTGYYSAEMKSDKLLADLLFWWSRYLRLILPSHPRLSLPNCLIEQSRVSF